MNATPLSATAHTHLRWLCTTVAYAALCAAMLSACSDDPAGNGGDTTAVLDTDTLSEVVSTSCSSVEDCAATERCDDSSATCVPRCTDQSCARGEVCDQESGVCVQGNACATHAECTDSGEICNGCRGVCEADEGYRLCEDDMNCLSNQYCEPCRGICLEKSALCAPCTFHYQCGEADDMCIDIISSGGRFCTASCQTLVDCDPGYTCEDVGGGTMQCVPASGDCASPAACEVDDDCPDPSTICRMGRCVPGCTPGGCPGTEVCEAARCVARCDQRAEGCVAPKICDLPSGLCKFEGECATSRDCTEPETYCDLTTMRCVAGCEVDNDCMDASKECREGSCVRRGCKGAYACAFSQFCDIAAGDCYAAEGPYCDTCDPDTEGSCGPDANKCIELQDKDGNAVGNFCFVACGTDPDNICPQGYQCTELQDQNGAPAGSVCFRDCTVDPFG